MQVLMHKIFFWLFCYLFFPSFFSSSSPPSSMAEFFFVHKLSYIKVGGTSPPPPPPPWTATMIPSELLDYFTTGSMNLIWCLAGVGVCVASLLCSCGSVVVGRQHPPWPSAILAGARHCVQSAAVVVPSYPTWSRMQSPPSWTRGSRLSRPIVAHI